MYLLPHTSPHDMNEHTHHFQEMQMQTYLENGELRGIIIGADPSIDSPAIYIETTRRHYAVIRMRYYGEATEAHLLCKGGSD